MLTSFSLNGIYFLAENRYESLLPLIAHGSPNFDTAAYTIFLSQVLCMMFIFVTMITYDVQVMTKVSNSKAKNT